MGDDEQSAENLEQLLRDERALRLRAEKRASEQTEKLQIWRTRAEERAARIAELTSRKPKRRNRARAAGPEPKPPGPPAPAEEKIARPTRMSTLRVATNLEHATWLGGFAPGGSLSSANDLAESDLVVVDLARMGDHPAPFAEWLTSPARQPLIVLHDGGDPAPPLLDHADAVLSTTEPGPTAGSSTPTGLLLPVFDPDVHNPVDLHARPRKATSKHERDGLRTITDDEGRVVAIESALPDLPPAWLVEAAASGTPIGISAATASDETAFSVAATAARRWAYRNHTPVVRAQQIAAMVGLRVHNPQPTVAAILISKRPHQAAAALALIEAQTYGPLQAIVGIHGEEPPASLRKAVEQSRVPTTLLELPAELTLGECLNRAIDETGAELLAKIDDDDYYGPHHIEDGVQALDYSQAGIVGKGAQFTYVEEEDLTVLRRRREEETFIGGSPTGATMLFRRSVWERIGFPHRPRQVDVLFTRAARHNGATVYANSRWEFCYVRQATGHTWRTSASTFLDGADAQWHGFLPEKTIVADLDA